MIFAIISMCEDRRYETIHLLNDLRNLNHIVYLLSDIDFDLERFQFHKVKSFKTDKKDWDDFERFHIIKKAMMDTDDYVYYLDSDSRFFDLRIQKYNKLNFIDKLNSINFDIMCSWWLDSIEKQLEKPDPNENKNIRNFKFGHNNIINYFKTKIVNYDTIIKNPTPLESLLIFRKSDKILQFINEMINIQNLLIQEDTNIGRIHKAAACGFAMGTMSNSYDIKIISNPLVYHYFKANFTREVFPFNFNIDINEKV
jgi:hypothetical protein